MKNWVLAAGLGLALSAGAASAEGWTIIDLGSVDERAECMRLAEATVDAYRAEHGGDGFTGRSEWTIGGYDMRGEAVDVLFICPIEAGLVAPFVIAYNSDSDNDARETVAARLEELWDQIVAGGVPTGGGGSK